MRATPRFFALLLPVSLLPACASAGRSGDPAALGTGPVLAPDGRHVATFTSIWRREAPGRWKIVFDRGAPCCLTP